MTFQVKLTRYQVETASDQFHSHIREKAEDIYQKYVKDNIPCEFFIDGIVQKKHKPNRTLRRSFPLALPCPSSGVCAEWAGDRCGSCIHAKIFTSGSYKNSHWSPASPNNYLKK